MSYNEGGISPGLLIDHEGDILAGSLAVNVSEPARMSPLSTNQKFVMYKLTLVISFDLGQAPKPINNCQNPNLTTTEANMGRCQKHPEGAPSNLPP